MRIFIVTIFCDACAEIATHGKTNRIHFDEGREGTIAATLHPKTKVENACSLQTSLVCIVVAKTKIRNDAWCQAVVLNSRLRMSNLSSLA